MRTLYIDVYFLINLTVDLLALYFASAFAKVPTSTRRLIVTAICCALFAVFTVLLPEITALKVVFMLLTLVFVALAATKTVSLRRKIKFTVSFLVLEAIIGGVFSLIWSIFDKYLYIFLSSSSGSSLNRKMLFFSIIILLTIGVFKMLVSFFSNIESEGVCKIEIAFCGKCYTVEAFVDSGNLAVDPMDMKPILFLKKEAAEKLLPKNVIELRDPDTLEKEIRKRIRLIPISRGEITHVLIGVRVDSAYAVLKDKKEEISVTIAIDKEGGTYGGYYALVPSGVLKDVFYR